MGTGSTICYVILGWPAVRQFSNLNASKASPSQTQGIKQCGLEPVARMAVSTILQFYISPGSMQLLVIATEESVFTG